MKPSRRGRRASWWAGRNRSRVLTVRLGETILLGQGAADDPDTRTFDLTAPLNAALADDPTSGPREVPLTASAVVPGMLTVSPPVVEFDLPP